MKITTYSNQVPQTELQFLLQYIQATPAVQRDVMELQTLRREQQYTRNLYFASAMGSWGFAGCAGRHLHK